MRSTVFPGWDSLGTHFADDKPIKTKRFPSSWELSGARHRRDQAPHRVWRPRYPRLRSRVRWHPAGRG